MKRVCTLCRRSFLSQTVYKYHEALNLCVECERGIKKAIESHT